MNNQHEEYLSVSRFWEQVDHCRRLQHRYETVLVVAIAEAVMLLVIFFMAL